MRVILFVVTRFSTVAAICWFGLWQESAGPTATRRFRRATAVMWLAGSIAVTWYEAASGSLRSRAALPLWLSLPAEVIVLAIMMMFPLLGLGLGERLNTKLKRRAKPPIAGI